jgi:hypothetical protein
MTIPSEMLCFATKGASKRNAKIVQFLSYESPPLFYVNELQQTTMNINLDQDLPNPFFRPFEGFLIHLNETTNLIPDGS